MVQFAVFEFTARAVQDVKIPGLPPAAGSLMALSVQGGRIAMLGSMTKGLPPVVGTIVKSMGALSLVQQSLAILPGLISGFLSPQSDPLDP